MTRTFVAEQVLEIARRVLQEAEDGRSVDPHRLAWADQVVRANTANPQPQDATSPARVLTEGQRA